MYVYLLKNNLFVPSSRGETILYKALHIQYNACRWMLTHTYTPSHITWSQAQWGESIYCNTRARLELLRPVLADMCSIAVAHPHTVWHLMWHKRIRKHQKVYFPKSFKFILHPEIFFSYSKKYICIKSYFRWDANVYFSTFVLVRQRKMVSKFALN